MSRKIFIAGDSTAATKAEDKRPETGWGEKLQQFCSTNYEVRNLAFNGASTKTFIKQGLLEKLRQEISQNDYLIIQFGHNDQKIEDPNWGTSISEYQNNLASFIDVAKQNNAIPIVLSSIIRRHYEKGKLINTLGAYPQAAHDAAIANDAFFIDLNKITFAYISLMSPKESQKLWLNVDHSFNYPQGIHDNTHLNDAGATLIAKLVAQEIAKLAAPLAKEIRIN
ncbi:MAG: rhamnogalacturonan acetylesterase [Gilliamella sp.]|nr:rhamnogalacturonan acetylesterase [Gilliamella sp.]